MKVRRPEPLCSPRARCYTLRFVGVPAASCEYCARAERLVNTWELLRAELHRVGLALLLVAGCSAGHQAHELQHDDAGDDAGKAWLCYCAGTYATTCAAGMPICSATDPSKRVARAEDAGTCTCVDAGACFAGADCIEVH